jgi:hypothetical protein
MEMASTPHPSDPYPSASSNPYSPSIVGADLTIKLKVITHFLLLSIGINGPYPLI